MSSSSDISITISDEDDVEPDSEVKRAGTPLKPESSKAMKIGSGSAQEPSLRTKSSNSGLIAGANFGL